MNRFIEGGRLTDRHKYRINTEETLSRLNQIAYDKVSKCKIPHYNRVAQICEEHGLKGLEKWINSQE